MTAVYYFHVSRDMEGFLMRRYLAPGIMLLAVIFGGLYASAKAAENISGAGSTFVYPVLSKWADAYRTGRGVAVNYQSIGSGGGIKQIENKTVDFGASDAPLPPAELDKFGLLQFPLVIGGDVPVVNLPGIEPGKLKLTGPILADIYLGKITKWSDKAIVAINPDLKLSDQAIAVVHRSDGSGTTYIWVDYLSKLSPEWKEKVGVNTSVEWPAGLGGKGNEGVAALVTRTSGAIGYVEYAYATQNQMTYTQVQNKEGVFVLPKKAAFQAAAAYADWAAAPAFFLMLTDQPGNLSWPITGSVFILMYKVQNKPENGKTALQFFDWVYSDGKLLAEGLDYVPMPANVVKLVESTWTQIKGADNQPVWVMGH
jgi:phosphate transport system substrate-binding protein